MAYETGKTSELVKELSEIFFHCYNVKSEDIERKFHLEELYYSDVDRTGTQFTLGQLDFIKQKYDIPISTKITYALVEHFLSNLTASKPSIELIAQEESAKPWVILMKRLVDGLWYENNLSNEFVKALRDACTVGSGFIEVKKSDFFQDSTYNVVAEHVSWNQVFVDPLSTRDDLKDARFMVIAEVLPRDKAELEEDITITDDDSEQMNDIEPWAYVEKYGMKHNLTYSLIGSHENDKRFDLVWRRRFYIKKTVKTYVSDDGLVSFEKPKLTQIPNPELEQLMMAHQQLAMQAEQMSASDPGTSEAASQMNANQIGEVNRAMDDIAFAIENTPKTIPAYAFVTERGDETFVQGFEEVKLKRVEKIVMINTTIKSKEVLPTDEIPVYHFCFSHFRDPNRTYGMMHYLKDILEGQNKLWGQLIHEMQLRTGPRVFYEESTVADPSLAENKFAVPGAWIGYQFNPDAHQGGMPQIQDISSVNQMIVQILGMMQQMAEYITGIFGVMQGNSESAPDTMGGIQSLQNFGGQRIKFNSRLLETPLTNLAYGLVRFIQNYAPLEVIQKFMPEQDVSVILEQSSMRFKTRASITNALPTSRQMAAVALASLAGQMATPESQQLLTEYSLKFMDIQEADEIAQKINVINNMQQQMQQMGQQMEMLQKQNQQLQDQVGKAMQSAEKERQTSNLKEKAARVESSMTPEEAEAEFELLTREA